MLSIKIDPMNEHGVQLMKINIFRDKVIDSIKRHQQPTSTIALNGL